jgi:hypothetical protein
LIERAVDLPRGEVALEEAGAALDAAFDEAGRRAGLADEADGAAHGIAAEASAFAPLKTSMYRVFRSLIDRSR